MKSLDEIKSAKNREKLVVLTAYDALFARLIEPYVDMVLVGDSLNMSFGGNADTLNITLDEMIYHAKAVRRGAKSSFIIFDMPFGSDIDEDTAIKSAIRAYKEAEIDAVKLEGGADRAHIIKALVQNKIAVMAHIGLLPQSVRKDGGYKVKGKTKEEEELLFADALAIEAAGAFALVIEGVKSEVATKITKKLKIPTIGIGAGSGTDGQVLVFSDMLGLFEQFTPKFVRKYMDGATLAKSAFESFAKDVKNSSFPNEAESY
jgi:3-methyl-2-oxobutanoate hydroxymethyltransferase